MLFLILLKNNLINNLMVNDINYISCLNSNEFKSLMENIFLYIEFMFIEYSLLVVGIVLCLLLLLSDGYVLLIFIDK